MRSHSFLAVSFIIVAILFKTSSGQSTPIFDTTNRSQNADLTLLLHQVIATAGGTPSDSQADADVTITAGGIDSHGRLRVLTRGSGESLEEWDTDAWPHDVAFSKGRAADRTAGSEKQLSFESALTSQSVLLPIPWLTRLLEMNDLAVESISSADESESGLTHLRLKETFAATPKRAHYREFTVCDLWLGTADHLLKSVSFNRRESGGHTPRILYRTEFDEYKNSGGFLYPSRIRRFLNGTLWADITVQTFAVNKGVDASRFEIKEQAK